MFREHLIVSRGTHWLVHWTNIRFVSPSLLRTRPVCRRNSDRIILTWRWLWRNTSVNEIMWNNRLFSDALIIMSNTFWNFPNAQYNDSQFDTSKRGFSRGGRWSEVLMLCRSEFVQTQMIWGIRIYPWQCEWFH